MTDLEENEDSNPLPLDVNESRQDNTSVGNLREQALQRKKRLLALRQRNINSSDNPNGINDDSDSQPVFRNYKPQSDDLKTGELPSAVSIDLTPYVSTQLEAANAPVVIEEVNLMNLAPRKPDWDLKRGVEKKLQKLERRTQRAIVELIRERLQSSDADLASTVNQQPVPFQ